MKVTKVTTTDNETSSSIDLFSGLKVSTAQEKEIRDQVGSFLVEQTLSYVAGMDSPIEGESWKSTLEKEYAKKKEAEIGNEDADIQFTGRTLDQLQYQDEPEGIKIGVFGERAPVADGHCNLSGKSKLQKRRFLPGPGQHYVATIERECSRIISDIIGEMPLEASRSAEQFRGIENQKELFSALKDHFGDRSLTRTELRLGVYRNHKLLSLLDEQDLLELL